MLTLTAHFQFPSPHLGTSVALIVPATEARMGRPFILRFPPPCSLYSASKDNEKCTLSRHFRQKFKTKPPQIRTMGS